MQCLWVDIRCSLRMDLDRLGDKGDNEPPAHVCCLQGQELPGQEGHRRLTLGSMPQTLPTQSEVAPNRAAALAPWAGSPRSPRSPRLQHQAPPGRGTARGLSGHSVPESEGRTFGLEGRTQPPTAFQVDLRGHQSFGGCLQETRAQGSRAATPRGSSCVCACV